MKSEVIGRANALRLPEQEFATATQSVAFLSPLTSNLSPLKIKI